MNVLANQTKNNYYSIDYNWESLYFNRDNKDFMENYNILEGITKEYSKVPTSYFQLKLTKYSNKPNTFVEGKYEK